MEVTVHFPGYGNVLEFFKIMNYPGKNIGCEKNPPWTKKTMNKIYSLSDIIPVEENFSCRRKRVPLHSLDIPC